MVVFGVKRSFSFDFGLLLTEICEFFVLLDSPTTEKCEFDLLNWGILFLGIQKVLLFMVK